MAKKPKSKEKFYSQASKDLLSSRNDFSGIKIGNRQDIVQQVKSQFSKQEQSLFDDYINYDKDAEFDKPFGWGQTAGTAHDGTDNLVVRPEHESYLYNTFLAALANPKKAFFIDFAFAQPEEKKRLEYDFKLMRKKIIESERITLADDFVKKAVALSFSYPKYILQLLPKAIPCFDNLWIEWNELVKFDEVQKHNETLGIPTEHDRRPYVANKTAYHIENRGSNIFQYTVCLSEQFYTDETMTKKSAQDAMMSSWSWFFSNEDSLGSLGCEHNGKPYTESPDLFNRLLGKKYCDHFAEEFPKTAMKNFGQQIAFGETDITATKLHYHTDLDKEDKIKQQLTHTAQACDGDLRFLAAVFSLLNYPRFVREVHSPQKIYPQIRWGQRVPRNELRVVEIELPKHGVNIYQQLFTGHGTPKRQHTRRGHWRILKDVHGRIKKRTWVKQCTVGNAELGIIEHEYILTSKSK